MSVHWWQLDACAGVGSAWGTGAFSYCGASAAGEQSERKLLQLQRLVMPTRCTGAHAQESLKAGMERSRREALAKAILERQEQRAVSLAASLLTPAASPLQAAVAHDRQLRNAEAHPGGELHAAASPRGQTTGLEQRILLDVRRSDDDDYLNQLSEVLASPLLSLSPLFPSPLFFPSVPLPSPSRAHTVLSNPASLIDPLAISMFTETDMSFSLPVVFHDLFSCQVARLQLLVNFAELEADSPSQTLWLHSVFR